MFRNELVYESNKHIMQINAKDSGYPAEPNLAATATLIDF